MGALAAEIEASARSTSRMVRDAVATVAKSQTCLHAETAGKIKKHDLRVDAYAAAMKAWTAAAEADIAKKIAGTVQQIKQAQGHAAKAAKKGSAGAARQKSALEFVESQLKIAEKDIKVGFIKKFNQLADDRSAADDGLAAATRKLNDALAKQAAIMDSRFSKTVKNLNAARHQAGKAVIALRKDFATKLVLVTSQVKKIETLLVNTISVVSGETISESANRYRVNLRVDREIKRILKLANVEYSQSKRARGKLKILMDENKAAASDEVAALAKSLHGKISHARARAARSRQGFAMDLSKAAKALYEKMAALQKAGKSLVGAASLAVATDNFKSKIVMLASAVAAGAKRAQPAITGVVHSFKHGDAADHALNKDLNTAAQADLNKCLTRAIMMGEARGKAVEQRIAEHKKHVKRYLQIELASAVDRTADSLFATIRSDRQKIADNYLSLKAYAVTAADKVVDTIGHGHGRYLSSVGDLLQTVGSLGPVKPLPAEGLGMGGDTVGTLFSGETFKVPAGKATINGLVNA